MTDANTDTQAQPKKTTEQNVNTQTDQTLSTDLNIDLDTDLDTDLTAEHKTAEASVQATETPAMKKVDIVIAGVTYQIYCPVNEEEELRSAVYFINNAVLDTKKAAPSLGQENLLVLCCLNLFEKMHSQQKIDENRRYEAEKAALLLNKIVLDAQSIL